ncbi:MAG: TonB-dependent receptor [Opitutaceae bacterium]
MSLNPASLSAQEAPGLITGRVLSMDSGYPLAGADVTVDGTVFGVKSDVNGSYIIVGVPPGVYTLRVTKEFYRSSSILGVLVRSGQPTRSDLPMTLEADVGVEGSTVSLEEFVVSSEIVAESDLGLLRSRQMATAVSDAIGSESFSRLGIGDAAEAMSKVTGASVVDGKYVMIRGLGDRYSNTLLNGVSVPSADPDKRAVQMDQFPSDLLESIVTSKSFTPDQPGAFSGGSVNLRTRSFPERFFVKTGVSMTYNDQVTGQPGLVIPGGGSDWKGMDDGTRALPADLPAEIPSQSRARIAARNGDFGPAEILDQASKVFHNDSYFPTLDKAGMDYGVNFAMGDYIPIRQEQAFGYIVSLTYDSGTRSYTDGISGRYGQGSSDMDSPDFVNLNQLFTYDLDELSYREAYEANPDVPGGTPQFGVTSTTQFVNWGAYAQAAYRFSANHEVTLRYFLNQSADDRVKHGVGEATRSDAGRLYEIYDLLYTERSISSLQLSGKSLIPEWHELQVEWRLAHGTSVQEQPDYRTISYFWDFGSQEYASAAGTGNNRFFRDLTENSDEAAVDLTLPVTIAKMPGQIKFGGVYNEGDRTYEEKRFRWSQEARPYEIIENYPNPVGIVATTPTSVTFGNTISDITGTLSDYLADQKIWGLYAMADLELGERWRTILGVRAEHTGMSTRAPEGAADFEAADIDQTDLLPALSLVYQLNPKMNIRAAYGRTVARPLYRELAAVRVEDAFNDEFFAGNPDLELSSIDNFDLRWEWFPGSGEIVAASLFYKDFDKPIEVTLVPSIGSIQPRNVDKGRVMGVEFEFRKGLDFITDGLANFSVGANLSVIDSEVSIPEEELAAIRQYDPDASDTRELLGQSPYIVNLELAYDNLNWGTGVTLAYNAFGDRLSLVTSGALPDVYERSLHSLDFIYTQRLTSDLRLKFAAKNLLDASREKSLQNAGKDYYYEQYTTGRSFSLGLSWSFN